MKLDPQRTIVAVSSGLTPARRAILRVSGPDTRRLLEQLILAPTAAAADAKRRLLAATVPRSALLECRSGLPERSLTCRLYHWPTSRSFTGQPSAEIHLLGALPLVEGMLELLLQLGASPAERGEFTLRSFLAGKLDLAQAEAVLGVIEADDQQQLEWALEQLGGNLSSAVRTLRDQLLDVVAQLEAAMDFVEEDIEFISTPQLDEALVRIANQLRELTARLQARGSRARTPRVVLAGRPNAGKSSLLNALLGRPRAIVSPAAGTTRDVVSAGVRWSDLELELVDTAGLEELDDRSPRELAQHATASILDHADLILYCIDVSRPDSAEPARLAPGDGGEPSAPATPSDSWRVNQLRHRCPRVIVVGTKQDLGHAMTDGIDLPTSIHRPATVESLRQRILETLADGTERLVSGAMHDTAVRCSQALHLATDALDRGRALLAVEAGEELIASELRAALDDLASIIGEVHTEDILGEIFSRFCIGK